MPEIHYCEVCGTRITIDDVETGKAVISSDHVLCAEHMHLYAAGEPESDSGERPERLPRPLGEKKKSVGSRRTKKRSRQTDATQQTAASRTIGKIIAGMVLTGMIAVAIYYVYQIGTEEPTGREKASAVPVEEEPESDKAEAEPAPTPRRPEKEVDVTQAGKPRSDKEQPAPTPRRPEKEVDVTQAGEPRSDEEQQAPKPRLQPPPPAPASEAQPLTNGPVIMGAGDIILDGDAVKRFPEIEPMNLKEKAPELGNAWNYLLMHGNNNNGWLARVFIKFNLERAAGIKDISSARIVLVNSREIRNRIVHAPLKVIVGVSDRDLATLGNYSWNSIKKIRMLPGTDSVSSVPEISQKDSSFSLDVTAAVKKILAGDIPNNGFLLRFQDEENWSAIETYSSDYRRGKYSPKLEIMKK